MSFQEYIFLLAGMGLVTYIPRLLPLLFLSQRTLPCWFTQWLELIPVAILAALLAPSLVMDGSGHLDLSRKELWVGIPTFLFALRTKSLGGTVLAGMALSWLAGMI
jgi:branched-subunit amino acid transport protein